MFPRAKAGNALNLRLIMIRDGFGNMILGGVLSLSVGRVEVDRIAGRYFK